MGERLGSDDAKRSAHNDAPMLVKGLEWHLFNFFREVEGN
jgi:hypothetical protein